MKFFTAILLFVIVLTQTFSSFFTQADFYLNRDYIAKNICVNRDKPMMHCEGKCYLKRKLKEEGKNQSPASRTEKFDLSPFYLPASYSIMNFMPVEKIAFFIRNEKVVPAFSASVFHPPAAKLS